MCGILGYFGFNRSSIDAARFAAHVGALAHRGPDDAACWRQGPFFFGHRRLAIIDLNHGRQPMWRAERDLSITFNGEIYNYLELRDELSQKGYVFRTQSDTEVLLHGYREWGTDLPRRLVGMFAFGIADLPKRELFLARDPFGEKPLLYATFDDGVLFASELSPISALLGAHRTLNAAALARYLCLNYVAGDDTLMTGVKRLSPGTWRLYDRHGGAQTAAFWRPPEPLRSGVSEREALDRIEGLLGDSVRLALRSDVPVGMFLSGGIDSALIARFASEVGRLAHAFCLTFDESSYSEWDRASLTARQLGIPLTRVSMDASAMARFSDVVAHADDPLADSSALAVFTLSSVAARHVKVVLSGDGGDELFGGYLTYKATAWHSRSTSRLPARVRRTLARIGRRMPTREGKVSTSYKAMRYLRALDLPPNEAHFTWNGTWLPTEAARLVHDEPLKAAAATVLADLARTHRVPIRPSLYALQCADVADYLPNDILSKTDRMSMAHGLEVRAPFLNPSLAAYALSLPSSLKVTMLGPTKRILRALAARRYGSDIANAGKQGFSIPIHAWLRGPARQLVNDLLSPASIAKIDALEPCVVEAAVAEHMSGRRSLGWELWGLMVLAAWHRQQIEAPPPRTAAPPPPELFMEEGLSA